MKQKHGSKKLMLKITAWVVACALSITSLPVTGFASEITIAEEAGENKKEKAEHSEQPAENAVENAESSTEGTQEITSEITPENPKPEEGTAESGGQQDSTEGTQNPEESTENQTPSEEVGSDVEEDTTEEPNAQDPENEDSTEEATPEDTTSEETIPEETAPENSTEEVAPEEITPEETTPVTDTEAEIPEETENDKTETSKEDTKEEKKDKDKKSSKKKNKKNKNKKNTKKKSKIKVTEVADLYAFTSAVQAETANDDLTPAYEFRENSKKMYVHGEQKKLEKKVKGTGEHLTVPESIFSEDIKVDNAKIANGDGVVTLEIVAAVSDYEVIEQEDSVELINPWQNKRLLVRSPMGFDPKDAVSIIQGYDDMFIITYETEEAAKAAYTYLLTIPYLTVETDVTLSASALAKKDVKQRNTTEEKPKEEQMTSLQEAVKELPKKEEQKEEKKKAETTEQIQENTQENTQESTQEIAPVTVPEITPESLAELVIAVLDTGYDMKSCDTTRIVSGLDLTGSNTLQDENGHGTAMANIILENTKNTVKVMPVKVADTQGRSSSLKMYLGIRHAIESGADVINISMSAYKPNDGGIIKTLIEEAKNKGIHVVTAAGNYGEDTLSYVPANVDAAIVVSAVNTDETLDSYSNYGATIDYCASGSVEIKGLENKKTIVSGTSVSAAIVSAVIGNIKAKNKDISLEDTEKQLKKKAKDLGVSGWDTSFGYGMLTIDGLKGKEEEKENVELPELLTCDWKSLSTDDLNALIEDADPIYQKRFLDDMTEKDKAELLAREGILYNNTHTAISYDAESGKMDKYVGALKDYFYTRYFDEYRIQRESDVTVTDRPYYAGNNSGSVGLKTSANTTEAKVNITTTPKNSNGTDAVNIHVSATNKGAFNFDKMYLSGLFLTGDNNGNNVATGARIYGVFVDGVTVNKPDHSQIKSQSVKVSKDDNTILVTGGFRKPNTSASGINHSKQSITQSNANGTTQTINNFISIWDGEKHVQDVGLKNGYGSNVCKDTTSTDVGVFMSVFELNAGQVFTLNITDYDLGQYGWSDWYVLKKGSCTENGIYQRDNAYYCKNENCKYIEDKYEHKVLAARGHNLATTVITNATCTTNGKQLVYCTNTSETDTHTACKYTAEEPIPKLGHDLETEWSEYKKATCTEKGEMRKKCKRTGCAYYESKATDPLGHDMDDWYVDKEPTCVTEGIQISECKRCNYYEEEPVPELGHVEPEEYAYAAVVDIDKMNESNGSIVEHIQKGRKFKECTRNDCAYIFEEAYRQSIYRRSENTDGTWTNYTLVYDVYCEEGDALITHTIDGQGWHNDVTVTMDRGYTNAHRYYVDAPLRQYNITFNGNNPNNSKYTVKNIPDPATGGYRANTTISDTVPSIYLNDTTDNRGTGFEFTGWKYTHSSGQEYFVQPGDTFAITEDTTLYAQWSRPGYKITLDNQGADIGKEGTKEMYEVYADGYYQNKDTTVPFYTNQIRIPEKNTDDATLLGGKRKMKFKGYTDTPVYNASSGGKIIEEDGTLIKNVVKFGYTTADYTYFLKDSTIYAQWENMYAIQYDINLPDEYADIPITEDMLIVPEVKWKTAGENIEVEYEPCTAKAGTKGKNARFKGWSLTPKISSDSELILSEKKEAIIFTEDKDITLYAQWGEPVFEITLNNYWANVGEGTKTVYAAYGEGYYSDKEATKTFPNNKITIPKKTIADSTLPGGVREQYFSGYFDAPQLVAPQNRNQIIEADGTLIKNVKKQGNPTADYSFFKKDSTIYAVWENMYAIQYDDNLSDADIDILNKDENDRELKPEEDGELIIIPELQWKISGKDITITYEPCSINEKSAARDIYRFKGWSLTPEITSRDEIVLSESKTSYTFTDNKDITLYAQWDTSFTMAYMGNVQTEGTDYLEKVADIEGAYTFNPNEAEQVALLPNDDADYFVKTVERTTVDIETGENTTEDVPCGFGGWSMFNDKDEQDDHEKYLTENGQRENDRIIKEAQNNDALTFGSPKADFGTNDAPHPNAMNLLANVYGAEPQEGPVANYLNELAEMPYVNMHVIWDEYPQIHATDIYMSLAEAQSGVVTEEYLLNLTTATDEELKSASNIEGKIKHGEDATAGTSYTILDYQAVDFTCAEAEMSFSITYRAEDAAGNVTTKLVRVYLVDTTGEPVNTGEVRFISAEYIDTLAADSIWRTGEYATKLAEVLGNSKTGIEYTTVTPVQAAFGAKSVAKPGSGTWNHVQQIWEFTHEEVLAVQSYVDSHKGTVDPAEFLANFGGNRIY